MKLTKELLGKRVRQKTWSPGWWFIGYSVKDGKVYGITRDPNSKLNENYYYENEGDWEEYSETPKNAYANAKVRVYEALDRLHAGKDTTYVPLVSALLAVIEEGDKRK